MPSDLYASFGPKGSDFHFHPFVQFAPLLNQHSTIGARGGVGKTGRDRKIPQVKTSIAPLERGEFSAPDGGLHRWTSETVLALASFGGSRHQHLVSSPCRRTDGQTDRELQNPIRYEMQNSILYNMVEMICESENPQMPPKTTCAGPKGQRVASGPSFLS